MYVYHGNALRAFKMPLIAVRDFCYAIFVPFKLLHLWCIDLFLIFLIFFCGRGPNSSIVAASACNFRVCGSHQGVVYKLWCEKQPEFSGILNFKQGTTKMNRALKKSGLFTNELVVLYLLESTAM